jgi:hypothetical protein
VFSGGTEENCKNFSQVASLCAEIPKYVEMLTSRPWYAISTERGSGMSCISPCHVDRQQLVQPPAYFSWPQGFYLQAPLTQKTWWDGRQISESEEVQSEQVQEPRHCAVPTCPQAVPLCVQNYPVSEAKSRTVRINTYFTKCLSHCKTQAKITLN